MKDTVECLLYGYRAGMDIDDSNIDITGKGAASLFGGIGIYGQGKSKIGAFPGCAHHLD